MHSKVNKTTKISVVLIANISIIMFTYKSSATVVDVLWIYLLQSLAIVISVAIALLTKKRIVESIGVLLGFFFFFGLLATFLAMAMSIAFDQPTPTGSNPGVFGLNTVALGFITYLVAYLIILVFAPLLDKNINNTQAEAATNESLSSLGVRMLPIFLIVFLVTCIGPSIGILGSQVLLVVFQLIKTALDYLADTKTSF